MTTNLQRFLRKHPVFTYEHFARTARGGTQNTIRAMLTHHIKQGHVVRVRKGLFASIPYGADPAAYPINPFLLGSYAAPDAVLGYHTALAFYQVTYSVSYRFIYLTRQKTRPFNFRSEQFINTAFPQALLDKDKQDIFVNTEDVQGLPVRITSLERTLVDVLDRPLLGGGWEEIWRSLDMIERLKIDNIIKYVLLLNNSITTAKVGFYLSQRQQELKISQAQLEQLRQHATKFPRYMDATAKKNGRLVADWNLIIPTGLLHKNWQE